jgi:hypothetical protein
MGTVHERHVAASTERVGGEDPGKVRDTVTARGTGRSAAPGPWSSRIPGRHMALPLHRDLGEVRRMETPAGLIRAAGLPRVDFTDTFALRLPPGSDRDVGYWHRALQAAGIPLWAGALMAVRNRVARGLGLRTAGRSGDPDPFRVLTWSGDTLVVGADDRHLDFRGVLRVVGDDLQCATVVRQHNVTGRAYFAVVKPFHRRIVPALLRRARSGVTG